MILVEAAILQVFQAGLSNVASNIAPAPVRPVVNIPVPQAVSQGGDSDRVRPSLFQRV